MQAEFTYSAAELESIRLSLSEERLGPYLTLSSNDLREALRLYERNTALSEALYGLLQGLEVTLPTQCIARSGAAFRERIGMT